MTRSVVLVGLMGAGKSCVGRRLAAKLGWDFRDSDAEFEDAAGSTVSDYFARYGEAAFRDGERKVIARLLRDAVGNPIVLATGGGAFCDAETRTKIQEVATSVWLRAELDLLVSRTEGRTHRPLLQKGNPRDTLAALMETRYPLYALADVVVDTRDTPPEVTVSAVHKALQDHWQKKGNEQ